MEPVQPVFPASGELERTYYGPKETYPLPTFNTEKCIVSRWSFSDEERAHIANGGDLFIAIANHGHPIWPFMPVAAEPEQALSLVMEMEANL